MTESELTLKINFHNVKENPTKNEFLVGKNGKCSFKIMSDLKNTFKGMLLKKLGCQLRLIEFEKEKSVFVDTLHYQFYKKIFDEVMVKEIKEENNLISYNLQTMHKEKLTDGIAGNFSNGIVKTDSWMTNSDHFLYQKLKVYIAFLNLLMKSENEKQKSILNNFVEVVLKEDEIDNVLSFLEKETSAISLKEDFKLYKNTMIEFNAFNLKEKVEKELVSAFLNKNNELVQELINKYSCKSLKESVLDLDKDEKTYTKKALMLMANFLLRKLTVKYDLFKEVNTAITLQGVSSVSGLITIKDIFKYIERQSKSRVSKPLTILTRSGVFSINFDCRSKELKALILNMLETQDKNVKICHGFGKFL